MLLGWIATTVLIVGAYVTAWANELIRPDVMQLLKYAGPVIALLAPQITLAMEFVFSNAEDSTQYFDAGIATAVILMCSTYWILLIAGVWAGVVYRQFGAADGTGLETATNVIVSLAGLLSFLAIKPTVKLFTHQSKIRGRTSPSRKTKSAVGHSSAPKGDRP